MKTELESCAPLSERINDLLARFMELKERLPKSVQVDRTGTRVEQFPQDPPVVRMQNAMGIYAELNDLVTQYYKLKAEQYIAIGDPTNFEAGRIEYDLVDLASLLEENVNRLGISLELRIRGTADVQRGLEQPK